MLCVIENLFEDGEWAILEWRDPLGLRGCGFFYIQEGRIAFQRGYWDKLSFSQLHRGRCSSRAVEAWHALISLHTRCRCG